MAIYMEKSENWKFTQAHIIYKYHISLLPKKPNPRLRGQDDVKCWSTIAV